MSGEWKSIRKNGRPALRSPSGKIYFGTPAEVDQAALMPWRRDQLAESLHVQRRIYGYGIYSANEMREACAKRRREAIQLWSLDAAPMACVTVPAAVLIQLVAGARLVKNSTKEYWDDIWDSELTSLLDVAEEETGKREIPLNRHERAALARCEAAAKNTLTRETREV